jgi:hypothetical protein
MSAAAVAFTTMWLVACSTVPNGPSLSNVSFSPAINDPAIWKQQQQPTVVGLNGQLDPTVCCCHITGTISNHNSVPVYALITFAAMGDSSQSMELSRTLFYSPDLLAGQSQPIMAPPASAECLINAGPQASSEPIQNQCAGFLLACSSINHVNYQISITSAGGAPLF